MTNQPPIYLAEFSTHHLTTYLRNEDAPVVLWPVGSTEPHGPHLPLATDIILSEENAVRAAEGLRQEGIGAVVAPNLPYGVTDFAEGFAGAISIPEDTLVAFIVAGCGQFLSDGFAHVCLINHHLEPGQLSALQRAHDEVERLHGEGSISLPKVVSRRWGRSLGAEFMSGACHAGEYEGSLILAARPDLFNHDAVNDLPEVPISLSQAINAGQTTFLAAGASAAYTGSPKTASKAEGERLYAAHQFMVTTEVKEHLEKMS